MLLAIGPVGGLDSIEVDLDDCAGVELRDLVFVFAADVNSDHALHVTAGLMDESLESKRDVGRWFLPCVSHLLLLRYYLNNQFKLEIKNSAYENSS